MKNTYIFFLCLVVSPVLEFSGYNPTQASRFRRLLKRSSKAKSKRLLSLKEDARNAGWTVGPGLKSKTVTRPEFNLE